MYDPDQPLTKTLRAGLVLEAQKRPGRLTLRLIDGPNGKEEFELRKTTLQVGRSSLADVTVADPSISKIHFELRLSATGIELRDRDSKNGVWLNGCRVFHAQLRSGDSFRAGDRHFMITSVGDIEVQATVSARCGLLEGSSVLMRELFGVIDSLSLTPLDVLILGETGTGKELTARTLHQLSERRSHPFITLDCGAISTALAESTMFGFRKGAYTGANRDQPGIFEEANTGTIFLDEIGELPLELQVKLLRVLERREVMRLGEPAKVRPLDIRIVAATHRDLRREVSEGRFREDLFYRLARGLIEMPPLRERGEDIIELAQLFLVRLRSDFGVDVTLSDAARETLRHHSWSGNVRELKNCIEQAAHMKRSGEITPSDLRLGSFSAKGRVISGLLDTASSYEAAHLALDRILLASVLDDCGGNLSEAARRLSISRPTLRAKLRAAQLYPAECS